MFRNLLTLILFAGFSLALTVPVFAANLSLRVGQPKTPTNQNNFNINFVALDILDRPIAVKCFKKGPSDAIFSQFGSDISLSAGGNTGNCQVTSTVITAEGSYQFYLTAQAGSDLITSSTLSIEYNFSAPGTPGNYSKEKVSSCDYKIKFKTADDGGKTSKVEVYRSDQTSFSADAASRVGSVSIGSNSESEYINSVPDCNKAYYFAARAFSDAGTGSGIVSDEVVKVITTSAAVISAGEGVTSTSGAIQVIASRVTNLDSETSEKQTDSTESGVLSEQIDATKTENTPISASSNMFTAKNVFLGLLIGAALLFAYFYRKVRKS